MKFYGNQKISIFRIDFIGFVFPGVNEEFFSQDFLQIQRYYNSWNGE